MFLLMIPKRILALETLVAGLLRALVGSVVTVALVVVLEVVADHEGLAAAALLALVRSLVGVGPRVLLQVALCRELLAALRPVAVERVPRVEARVGVESVQGREGVVTAFHLAHERLLTGVDADVDLGARDKENKREKTRMNLPEIQYPDQPYLVCQSTSIDEFYVLVQERILNLQNCQKVDREIVTS